MKIVTTLLLSLFASSVLFAQSGKTVRVQTRANSTVENWTPYEAHTVDNLKGFKRKGASSVCVRGHKTNRRKQPAFSVQRRSMGDGGLLIPKGIRSITGQ